VTDDLEDDDDGPPRSLHLCSDCHKASPPTSTGFTLISAQYGWRLWRQTKPGGDVELKWYCPECWKNRKEDLPPSSRRFDGR